MHPLPQLFWLFVACSPAPSTPTMTSEPKPIPIEEVARYPQPGTSLPTGLSFAPSGDRVLFLDSEDDSLTRQLYAYDIATGEKTLAVAPPGGGVTEEDLSLEEQLQRERRRERGLGITRYHWSWKGERLLLPIQGGLYVQDGIEAALRLVVPGGEEPALSPRFSRDGSRIAYVRDAEIYVVSADGGEPVQITRGARGTGRTHGLAEFAAQEEMSRQAGFWWSRDGRHIAFTEVDETHIPVYRIAHLGKAETVHEDHAYPFAGAANARVTLAVVPSAGGEPVWMDLTAGGALEVEYLARVHWMPDGSLFAQVQDREQSRLDLLRLDPQTGAAHIVLTETSDVWINLHHILHGLPDGRFLWASERTGFQHLYLVSPQGEATALTAGDWMVDRVVSVDEDAGQVYFEGTRDGVTERHLYAVSLDGGAVRRITVEPGLHGCVIDRAHRYFIDTYSRSEQPPSVAIRSLEDGTLVATLFDEQDPRIEALGLRPPELITLETRDGVKLHGAIYRPEGPGPYPTLVSVYGGPHAQRVTQSWGLTADMRAQYLRSQGFLIFKLDNRGSARRGLAFEGALRHDMGNIELQDQVDGVAWLVSRGLADPGRVGIYGWSYGGYMSAMALARAPDTFQVAVAGAPVTHWDGYDTHYTERYMGTPQANPEGYEISSVMHHVPAMKGQLLLVHGLIDENVHFRHTARLVNALNREQKSYELLMFPDERHMPRREADRVSMEARVRDFFVAHLQPN